MKNFQDNSFKRLMYSNIGLAFFGLVILFFAWNIIKFSGKTQETSKNKNLAEEKFLELQKEQVQLGSDINKLNTVKGTEENIREKFGLVKEDEGLIVIVDDQNISTDKNNTQNSSFWFKIKSWFK
jgi:cell division protein FtsB